MKNKRKINLNKSITSLIIIILAILIGYVLPINEKNNGLTNGFSGSIMQYR